MAYAYNHHMILVLICLLVLSLLCRYAFRNRCVPGARPFMVLTVLLMFWIMANGLTLIALPEETKILWFKFRAALMLPIITACFIFSLDYAGLERWVSLRTLSLLAIPLIILVLLILTNDVHHLIWKRIRFDGRIHLCRGPIN